MWSTPVVDRSKTDVEYLKSIIAKLRDIGYSALGSSEKADWDSGTLKGALNISDLNRIEDNIDYLVATLATYGYNISIVTRATWLVSDIPYLDDIDRIKTNITNIISGFYDDPNNPTLTIGQTAMDYIILNDIETVLFNINVLLDGMIYSIKRCGTFNCGATIFL